MVIKLRRIRWVGHVASIGDARNAYSVLIGENDGKRSLGRSRHRWEDDLENFL
jgi:hypothetical protein